jgi:hypothetical protein
MWTFPRLLSDGELSALQGLVDERARAGERGTANGSRIKSGMTLACARAGGRDRT